MTTLLDLRIIFAKIRFSGFKINIVTIVLINVITFTYSETFEKSRQSIKCEGSAFEQICSIF